MRIKTIVTHGERTIEFFDAFGLKKLFPEGTKRIVLDYRVLPRNLGGETRRGLQYVEQEASIEMANDAFSGIIYNAWHDKRYVERPPEQNEHDTR